MTLLQEVTRKVSSRAIEPRREKQYYLLQCGQARSGRMTFPGYAEDQMTVPPVAGRMRQVMERSWPSVVVLAAPQDPGWSIGANTDESPGALTTDS